MCLEFNKNTNIDIYVDTNKNVVIFPRSILATPVTLPTGEIEAGAGYPAYYPIELRYPYTINDLADKIKEATDSWNKYECYIYSKEKVTIEEKYFGVKGIKKVMQGLMHLFCYSDEDESFVNLSLPMKRGYCYIGVHETELPQNADCIDFAKAVVELLNMDLTEYSGYKTYKKSLNL